VKGHRFGKLGFGVVSERYGQSVPLLPGKRLAWDLGYSCHRTRVHFSAAPIYTTKSPLLKNNNQNTKTHTQNYFPMHDQERVCYTLNAPLNYTLHLCLGRRAFSLILLFIWKMKNKFVGE